MRFRTMQRASLFGTWGMLVAAAAMLLSNLTMSTFWGYECATWFMLLAMGFVFTGATTVAMDKGREYIGVASATVGASGFIMGGACVAVGRHRRCACRMPRGLPLLCGPGVGHP